MEPSAPYLAEGDGMGSLSFMFKKDKLAIDELKQNLDERKNNPVKMLKLFGSKARGDDKRGSDIDLFVLSEDEKKARDFLYDISEKILEKYNAVMSFIVYSSERYYEHRMRGSLFIRQIEREGSLIWKRK